MNIEDVKQCSTGSSELFPTPQCPGKPTTWIFGDAYCDQCASKLVKIHVQINGWAVSTNKE